MASRKACKTAAAENEPGVASPRLPYNTQWHRDHGPGTRRDKAIKQQLLTPREEQAIVDFVLRADRNGFPARVKDLHHYAAIFLRGRAPQRRRKPSSKEQRQVPAKDWPQAFCKRHPELKVARLRALDWRRHEKNIYKKIVNWFDLMRAQLEEANVLQENVYNLDETGVLLSVIESSKCLVNAEMHKSHTGTDSKRTLITVVECTRVSVESQRLLSYFPESISGTIGIFIMPLTGSTPTTRNGVSGELSLSYIYEIFMKLTIATATQSPTSLRPFTRSPVDKALGIHVA